RRMTMTDQTIQNEVSKKLKSQLSEAKKAGRYAAAVADECVNALEIFAGQEEEFARAILDGNFEECMKAVEKECSGKKSVSDLEVYRACVRHYFKGADVVFQMSIRVNPYDTGAEKVEAERNVQPKTMRLDLDDFFD
ncbi:MAG: hypothetical protein ACI3XR_04625, partial [Eubacteriales bacterium]